MHRATLGLIIGYINVGLYVLASIYFLYALVLLGQIEDDTRSYGFEIGVCAFMLVLCLVMIGISILLIMGINKKRAKLMAPWIYLTIGGIVFNILQLITSGFKSSSNSNVLSTIVIIAIQILIWYPIYTLYKDIRSENRNGRSPPNNENVEVASPIASYNPQQPTVGWVPQKE